MDSALKINLGCGNDYREGYYNVDDCSMYPNCKVDDKKNVKEMIFPDKSVNEILANHLVMYLRPDELQPLLINWYAWLKDGGKLVIETIDLKKICKIVASEKSNMHDWGLINLFGRTDTGPHKWGWTKKTLTIELYKAGFTNIKCVKGDKKPERDIKIIAIK